MQITAGARALYDKLAVGWNTWDVRSVTAHVHLPSRLRVNLNFFVSHLCAVARDHAWNEVESFGEHAPDGSYTDVTVRLKDGHCRVETASVEELLLIRVTPVKARSNYYAALAVETIWGGRQTIGYEGDSIVADDGDRRFTVRALTPLAQTAWDPISAHHIICDANAPAYFVVNSTMNKDDVDKTINCARETFITSTICSEGDLGEGLSAMRRCLLWNTVYDNLNKRVVSPVSRNWCRNNGMFGDYVVFGWDTFFAGLQMGLVDKDLAYANIFSILEEITPEGMVPNFGSANGWSRDRSEPQVGSLCVWKLYLQFNDKWFVEECYDRLLLWNRWRFETRDANGDGLLELASKPWALSPEDEAWGSLQVGEKQGAMWESGIDNSPMWDRAVFNTEHHCMELSYVGLNALMVMDCQILAKMAALLGNSEDEAELSHRAAALGDRINGQLWDDHTRCYMNRHWSGEFDPCLSVTHFYTLTAGIVLPERMNDLLEGHLFNPREFWGEYVLPNVSRTDPAFYDQEYWRGRIWAPTNYIVSEGMLRAGLRKKRTELTSKGLSMFLKCWRDNSVVGENYNAVTGEAAEKGAASDRFYHWGALLAYMALEERICFNVWDDRVEINEGAVVPTIHNIPVANGEKINV